MTHKGRVVMVTGGTRGVGRGIARELARQGARVFVTGRTVPNHEPFDEPVTAIRCDHREDRDVEAAFARVAEEAGSIDALVNNVWGGYEGMIEDGQLEAAAFLDLSNSESPDFIGRAIGALLADRDVLRHTGKVLVAAALATEYGFTDIDGKTPRALTLADV